MFFLSGYIAYNFVIGAYSYWGPKAGYNIYHMVSSLRTVDKLILKKTYIYFKFRKDLQKEPSLHLYLTVYSLV